MTSYTGTDDLYSGTADIDYFVNNKIVTPEGSQWTVKFSDSAYDEGGNRIHSKSALEASVSNTSDITIGAKYSLSGNNLYALRVYNKALTPEEIAQNHFADLAKFYQLEMYGYDNLSTEKKAMIHTALASYLLTSTTDTETKAAVQSAYTAAYLEAAKTGNEYYDAFTAAVIAGGYDLSEFSLLSKTQREEIMVALYGETITQDAIDAAVAAAAGVNNTTEEQYNSVYVADSLIYHLSFINTGKNGEKLYEEQTFAKDTDLTKYQREAIKNYIIGDPTLAGETNYIYNNFVVENGDGDAKAITAVENPLIYDNYLQLYTVDGGTYDDIPLQYGGENYLKNTDYSMQIVSSFAEDKAVVNFNWWLVDFRFTTKVSGTTIAQTSFDTIARWGRVNSSSSSSGAMSSSVLSPMKNSTSVNAITEKGYDVTKAQTYTLVADRTINESTTKYVYNTADYPTSEGNTLTAGLKLDSDYLITAENSKKSVVRHLTSLPELTDEQKEAIEAAGTVERDGEGNITAYKRNEPEYFNGAIVDIPGYTDGKFYVNDSLTGVLNSQPYTDQYSDTPIGRTAQGAYLKIHAIRIYDRVISVEEMQQNHFADIAKYHELDISNLFELSDTQKAEIYSSFANITLEEKTQDELQALYNETYTEVYYDAMKIEGNDSHNHVVDLAEYYSLDLSAYNALPDKAKAELYKSTDAQTPDDSIFNSDMQTTFDAWIDEAISSLITLKPITPIDGETLYVTDGLVSRVDFFDATLSDTVTGGTNTTQISYTGYYYDASTETWKEVTYPDVAANTKYNGDKSSYTKFFRENNSFASPSGKSQSIYLSGGTAPIGESWVVNANATAVRLPTALNGTNSSAKCIATTTIGDVTYYAAEIYDKDNNVVGTYSYYFPENNKSNNPFVYATGNPDYYIQTNGGLAFESSFGDGYFSNGYYSGLSINNINYLENSLVYDQANAVDTKPNSDFTLQVVNAFDNSRFRPSGQMFMLGTFRFTLTDLGDNMHITSLSMFPATGTSYDASKTYNTAYGYRNLGVKITDATDFTFIYSGDFSAVTKNGAELTSVTGSYDFDMFVNNRLVNFESGASDIYYADARENHTFEVDFNAATKFNGLFKLGEGGTMNIYAIRLYSKALSQDEITQNHFADLATFHDIELDIFTLLSDDEKKALYEDMQNVYLTDSKESVHEAYNAAIEKLYYSSTSSEPTDAELHFYRVAAYYELDLTDFKALGRSVQLAICNEFEGVAMSESVSPAIIALRLQETILLQSSENFAGYYGPMLVTFEGYSVRKSSFPGLRSVYTIDKEILSALEEKGYTVTVGAMMGLAFDGETARTWEDLKVAETDGEYKITTTRSAFVEVYNGGFKNTYWDENKEKYGMAFTTVYEQESSQTVERYNTELIYGAYVVLEKDDEEDKLYYVDASSQIFGDSMSVYEVSSAVKENQGYAYSMIQKVLNAVDGTSFAYGKIAGRELSDYEFVYSPEDEVFATSLISELNAIIEEKTGVTLKSATTESRKAPCAIYIREDDTLEGANYGVYVKSGDLYITYDYAANAYYAMQIAKSLFDCEGDISIAYNYSEMGSVPTYKIVMLGASNVAVSDVFQAVDAYLQTQYGNISIELLNAGRAGGTIASALKTYDVETRSRVEREVYEENPDAVILQFIFNALGTSGITTNSANRTIERIWDAKNGVEISVDKFYDDNGNVLDVDAMKEAVPAAFTSEGRLNLKAVTYATDDAFNAAFADVEKTALVNYTIDKTFPLDLNTKSNNITEYTKFIYDLEALIADFHERGIDVILPTPVDYDEQLVNATGTSERIIGLKYIWADVDSYMKTELANRDGVAVVDYFAAQLELKGQLQENGADGSLMPSDRKHFKGMEGPYACATALMTDLIGKSLVLNSDATKADTLMTDYVASVSISANGEISASNASVTDYTALTNGVSFNYKPHGVSMAQVETLVKVREMLAEAKYEDTARYAENPNKEIIQIAGLDADTTYSIKIGESTLAATYTGAELAEGVDISLDANNPSRLVTSAIVDQLYTKRTNLAKLRNMSYVRETELFKRGVNDATATREQIFAVLDEIIAEKPEGNYARTTAEQYKEYYDIQDSFYSTVDLCDYNVKALLDFDAYTVTVSAVE